MRYLLDTNILIRLFLSTDPQYRLVRRIIRRLRMQGVQFCVLPQTLAEFWNVYTRPTTARGGYGYSVADTNRLLRSILRRFELLESEKGLTAQWQRLIVKYSVQGVQVHDARLVAAMLTHGVTHILTFNDADFARYTEVAVVHPASV